MSDVVAYHKIVEHDFILCVFCAFVVQKIKGAEYD